MENLAEQSEGTCYALNELGSRDDPSSTVDRDIRDAYGMPEYDVKWYNPDQVGERFSTFGERFSTYI